MTDPRILSVFISAGIALVVGILSFCVNLWKIQKEFKRAENRLSEELTVEMVKQRIDTYEKLMSELKLISSLDAKGKTNEDQKTKVQELIVAIQNNIFGRFGLIATHETREIVLRLRSKCVQFCEGKISFDDVKMASWKVHQMVRSDLGLPQPNLKSVIDRLRAGELSGKTEQIEALVDGINHNRWDS